MSKGLKGSRDRVFLMTKVCAIFRSIPTKKYNGDIGREQHGYPNSEELPA
jgi:hypothetical protein